MSLRPLPHLLWLDFESTGVDIDTALVLEAAAVLTTPGLDRLDSIERVIQTPGWDAALRANQFVLDMHTSNGLLADLESGRGCSLADFDAETRAMIDKHLDDDVEVLLAGSGVSHFDRPLIDRRLPLLAERLHYANLDLGVLRRTLGYLGLQPEGRDSVPHRAMGDIELFLDEFRGYRNLLVPVER